jgi:hypothetical protein
MDCEERLLSQAAMVKAVNPDTKVFVYRNLVKALPWYTNVWTKYCTPISDSIWVFSKYYRDFLRVICCCMCCFKLCDG